MKLLALLVLLSAFASLIVMEVVDDFGQTCPKFFLQNPSNQNKKVIPTVLTGENYKKICQFHLNKYRYATLYDTEKRIPVYSAYTFYKKGEKAKGSVWNNEPQLENKDATKEMDRIKQEDEKNYFHQAVDQDYKDAEKKGFTRGHVFSRGYTSDKYQDGSTFTFTNAAPQTKTSNTQWAEKVENPMKKDMTKACDLNEETPAYIVTGVIPSKDKWIKIERVNGSIDEGINIPTHYWTAFCCTKQNKRASKAYIAQLEDFTVEEKTVAGLNEELRRFYNRADYKVFGDVCLT